MTWWINRALNDKLLQIMVTLPPWSFRPQGVTVAVITYEHYTSATETPQWAELLPAECETT